MTVKEHIDRVRFDPLCVDKLDPDNGFRLIYPRPDDDDKYNRFLKKAHEIWQVTTGTMRASNMTNQNPIPKKKKKIKKKPTSNIAGNKDP